MHRINTKLLLIHIVSIFLIIGAFENIGILYNLELTEDIIEFGVVDGSKIYAEENDITPGEAISNMGLSVQLICITGLLIGTGLSIIKSRKFNDSLLNQGIMFILGFLFIRFDISNYLQFQSIFQSRDISLIISALVLIALGLIGFYSKKINNWIEH